MGTKLAPGYACNTVGEFERRFVYTYHKQPLVYVRFIDDTFAIWEHLYKLLYHMEVSFMLLLHRITYSVSVSIFTKGIHLVSAEHHLFICNKKPMKVEPIFCNFTLTIDNMKVKVKFMVKINRTCYSGNLQAKFQVCISFHC